jgi:CxxC-x17-CxxC domain-containing protein
MYNPKGPYTVYCNECWASDKWDPFSYAKDYDSNRPFFDQLEGLLMVVPKTATYSTSGLGPNVNSEYTNWAGANKDCYLCFNASPANENCAYCRGIARCRDSFDVYYADEVERVYEGVNIHKSTNVAWGQNAFECLDSQFLLNCSNLQNCFGCVNLRHKSHYFFNESLEKEEWKKRVSEIVGSYEKTEEVKKRFAEYSLKFPRRENNNLKSVNCDGDLIFSSKDCKSCFEASNSENVKYSFSVKFAKDCYDLLGHGRDSELLLEAIGVGISTRVIGSWFVENSHNVEYSFSTRLSEYCFGCDGIKNGKFVILNKEYSEEEYKKIREKIIEELTEKKLYGLFAPPKISPFAYNETVGQENMPLTKEKAIEEGFRWEDDIPETHGKETLKPDQIPDHINDVSDSILNEVLACVSCGRNYKIIKPELQMYKKSLIPVPRKCFNCRQAERLDRRGPFKLFDRKCAKCGKSIKTNFSPDGPEIIYCESCYQQEVV